MDFLREWLIGITSAAMLGTVALAVTPSGAVKKVLQFGVALLIICAVLQPLTGWSGNIVFDGQLSALLEENSSNAEKTGQELLNSIIAEKTAAYIVSKAQAVGLQISVSIECRMGEYYPEPWSAVIRSRTPEHALSALSDIIGRDTGIPPERQRYVYSY